VDSAARTCELAPVEQSDAVLYGVRLQASLNLTEGLVIIPAKGSLVVATFMSPAAAYVALCSEVESIELGGSSNGPMIVLSDLATEIQRNTDRIKLIAQALTSGAIGAADGGAAYKASITGTLASPFVEPDLSAAQVGNENVKH